MTHIGFAGQPDATGFDQAPFYSTIGDAEAIAVSSPFAVPFNLADGENRIISQYDGSAALHTLAREKLAMLQQEYVVPLARMRRMLNVNLAEGAWLDWLGERVNFPRPLGDWQVGGYPMFGFDGQTEATGFGQAPFSSVTPYRFYRPALTDDVYRALLRGRGVFLRSHPSFMALEEVLHAVLGSQYNFGILENDWGIHVLVEGGPTYLPSLLRRPDIMPHILPVQPGVSVVITAT